MNMWVQDPKTKEPSVTLTAFIIGFLVACGKLLVSGLVIKAYTLPIFSGADFSLVIASLGGLYWARRREEPKDE